MTETAPLIQLNLDFLDQGAHLISELSDDTYTATQPDLYTSSVGDHFRHILEHYLQFVAGVDDELIDYDARKRDERLSTDRQVAGTTIDQIKQSLNRLPNLDCPIQVNMASSRAGLISPLTNSSLCRELQYLQAHTIHHYALIAMILKLNGVQPGTEFGIAPSTLRHMEAKATREEAPLTAGS